MLETGVYEALRKSHTVITLLWNTRNKMGCIWKGMLHWAIPFRVGAPQVRQKSTSTDMVYENFVFKRIPTFKKQKKFHERKEPYA